MQPCNPLFHAKPNPAVVGLAILTTLSHIHSLLPSTQCILSRASISSPAGPTSSLSTSRLPSRASPRLPFSTSASSSTSRWTDRQSRDHFSRAAKVQGLKSRAAFKLLQLSEKHRFLKPGDTVLDLGFAPGSWSQVAIDLTRPGGRVVGVDLIPAQPPRGVSTIQGDFLSRDVQSHIKIFLKDPERRRVRRAIEFGSENPGLMRELETGYTNAEKEASIDNGGGGQEGREHEDKCVDVVLSDMSAPWELVDGLYKKSVSNPYYRMINTSGNAFRDHVRSMDLCRSALQFSYETLKIGGHLVCKFYQGAEDRLLEKSLKAMFQQVHREKPESSRSESRESYFVGIKRLARVDKNAIYDGS